MGEKKKEKAAEGGEKAKEKGGGGGKKEDKAPAAADAGGGAVTVVLKVDMHCEGCAKKVRRAVTGFQGVESVSAESGKLTVTGKVDPWELRERVESKTRKKVVLVSPAGDPPPKKKEEGKGEKKDKEAKKEDKPKPPVVSTVVLKIRLHCEGCTQKIKRTIAKYKGVDEISINSEKELVTVKGTMDVNAMVPHLKEKLRRSVDIIPPKKDDAAGGGDKKEKGGGGGDKKDDKKEKTGGGDGGGEKKKGEEGGGEKKDGGGGGKKEEAPKVEANRMEYHNVPIYGGGYMNVPHGNGYHIEMAHAPQMFSDENPNACSIM